MWSDAGLPLSPARVLFTLLDIGSLHCKPSVSHACLTPAFTQMGTYESVDLPIILQGPPVVTASQQHPFLLTPPLPCLSRSAWVRSFS